MLSLEELRIENAPRVKPSDQSEKKTTLTLRGIKDLFRAKENGEIIKVGETVIVDNEETGRAEYRTMRRDGHLGATEDMVDARHYEDSHGFTAKDYEDMMHWD